MDAPIKLNAEESREFLRTGKVPPTVRKPVANPLPEASGVPPGKQVRAKGRTRHTPGTMNKTEARYAADLALRQKAGDIVWWAFESCKLKIAPNTQVIFDFMLLYPDGRVEFVDTKGHVEDDWWAKAKVAADRFFMFDFSMVKWIKGEWVKTVISKGEGASDGE